MVSGGSVQGVIRSANPRKGRDVGKLADARIGYIGVSVAIAVIVQTGICDATAFADFDISPKSAAGDLAFLVDQGCFCGQTSHQVLRPISLPRNQPDTQSMNITKRIIKMM